MEHLICSIRDAKAEAFGRPFAVPKAGQAVRAFIDEVNRSGEADLNKHPEDHDLYQLATFDDNTGRIEPLEIPKILARGNEVKA